MRLIEATAISASPARDQTSDRPVITVALVQHRWREDRDELLRVLDGAIGQAAHAGARAVFLPELTLSKYPAFVPGGDHPGANAEELADGPTFAFAAATAAKYNVVVHASLYQRAPGSDGRGLNSAIMVAPDGALLGVTHKLHIPISAGYYEDTYFRPGPASDPYPVYQPSELDGVAIGLPTCWDEWFPELARMYSLGGAEVLVYPTAIGSEPSFPAFDTEPIWQQVIVANGITAGTFMIVPNRIGDEGAIRFYGSSFISDPYGRVLAQAPRDDEAVVVARLDIGQRQDWLSLFPFLTTRRPDTYGRLVDPVDESHPQGDLTAGRETVGRRASDHFITVTED